MKDIRGINHVGIRVTSLDSARAFYEKIGFVFLVGPIGPEPVAVMEHPSGVNLNLILNADSGSIKNVLMDIPEKHPGITHIALDVSDLAVVQSNLARERIPITEGPIDLPDGTSMIFIRDHDENVIEFHSSSASGQVASPMAGPFEEYFSDYADAFDRFHAERIAAHYSCPCLMVNDEVATSFSTPEAILQNTTGILAHHRSQNVGRAHVSEFQIDQSSENLAIVRVRWRIYDREEALLWDWLNSYNLVDRGAGWKIAVSTTHPMTVSASAPWHTIADRLPQDGFNHRDTARNGGRKMSMASQKRERQIIKPRGRNENRSA